MSTRIPNGLDKLGLENIGKVYYNLSYDELQAHEVKQNECNISSTGTAMCDTGIFTGRSPKDKYFVDQSPSNEHISWGKINKKIDKEKFEKLYDLTKTQLSNSDVYIMDVYAGASKESRRSVRFISQVAWQAHFVKNMFIRPTEEELETFEPDFVVYNACKTENENFKEMDLNSEVYVAFDVESNISIIGGTWYGGEMKKGIFSMMNYWLPLEGKLSMHCSANVGENDDVALFFGLSGTGKTTLSTDPHRALIGDDEHGWDDNGVFNFEGGCYAKVIDLKEENEPEIFGAIVKDALLENVVADEEGNVDYFDTSKTQNTRVSYPIEHIVNHKSDLQAGHPQNIIFLSYDAFGVIPPVSKLNKEQAMYYFLSGYTAKVAGTERGITEPVTTFSACFGEAFLPLHPTAYAKLLGEKIDEHGVNVYLVNTGLNGAGKRMSIKDTRACINGILNGSINDAEFDTLPVFNLEFPKTLEGIADNAILNPKSTWDDEAKMNETIQNLAGEFVKNFSRYNDNGSEFNYASAGPQL